MTTKNSSYYGETEVSLVGTKFSWMVRMPPSFLSSIWNSEEQAKKGTLLDTMLFVPTEEFVALLPPAVLEHAIPMSSRQVGWDQHLSKLIGLNTIRSAPPQYALKEDERIAAALLHAEFELNRFLSSTSSNASMGGREFERTLFAVLDALGVSVELNVRTVAGEIDLLLAKSNKNGIDFFAVECKRTKRKVTLAQVVRLHGLQEVLKKYINLANAYVVTSAPPTRDAVVVTKLLQLNVVEANKLAQWLASSQLSCPDKRYPMFKTTRLRSNGSLSFPPSLMRYFSERRVIMIGMGTHLELWDSNQYLRMRDEFINSDSGGMQSTLNALGIDML